MNEEERLWCLWLWIEDTDYQLCDWDIDSLPNLYNQDQIRFEYNQKNQSRSVVSCTIFSAVWMISDLMNYEFSIAEIKEIDELSYQKWRIRWEWRFVKNAVDLVCKRRNEKHPDKKVAYYRISKYSPMIDEIIKKWYTINWNFCPTVEFAKDYYTDAIVDWYQFWTKTNWHAIDIIYDWARKVKDSYKGRKTYDWKKDCNRYELKHWINELTNFWQRYYVFTKVAEDNLEEIKRLNELKTLVLNAIDTNSKMRHLVNDDWFKNKLHSMNESNRKKLEDINIQLKRLS